MSGRESTPSHRNPRYPPGDPLGTVPRETGPSLRESGPVSGRVDAGIDAVAGKPGGVLHPPVTTDCH